ncbi:SixA phosphatase family protein [Aureitalea marina]|uniref:Phosphoglycerate mutase n=1 Tax=Aureitalea marina TaxID=930804 RepID=A0A2S7KNA9_9FLAO|nr:histidine phosphatase family protein [Aureitalea marina]PQB04043.1 phosphoglycerate mutase [Aureitalea marina]
MKRIFLLLWLATGLLQTTTAQQTTEVQEGATTYFLIRHAEKDRSDPSNKNPGLTKKGFFRADRWADLFSSTELDAIYSTDYDRTLMTASPTARKKELEIQLYDPSKLFSEEFQQATAGKTVLVVGHSNTTPAMVNAMIGENKYADMDDNDNGTLFVVTLMDGKSEVQILKLN